ncbi:histidine phosphatase family protein [Clostridiaceae bacterium 68-1-5]|uniref:Histidine phosphatase family protein n=1 Tax=Suipraeoptans intestinalis TaxID=2606628 RepID=A0A6N7URE7_9FIRM|nr:histidine phosphatase family protein [Suipraeoptans intestinalis]MSR93281.1 histidine phosphatase family protein [Suipraeoptans intestinalis]
MNIYFIRHGMTQGNKERRYIGKTEEALCKEGKRELQGKRYPQVEKVFVSPRLRCRETAAILYPHQEPVIVEELAECDFGVFEGKNADELQESEAYWKWIESGGSLPFPEGESREGFARRCLSGFEKVRRECQKYQIETAALVVHGGTIMSILTEVGRPKQEFYDYHVGNGEGYQLTLEEAVSEVGVWRTL